MNNKNKQSEIIFPISDSEKIVIELSSPLQSIGCCTSVPIVFIKNNRRTVLSEDDLLGDLYVFKALLWKALNSTFQIHPSITKDIGYLYNEYCESLWNKHYKTQENFAYKNNEKSEGWIGAVYNLWAYDFLTCWLYVDMHDSIVFEITPMYPEEYVNGRRKDSTESYKKWIKNYKPFYIIKIPKEVAQKWLQQTTMIIEAIEGNSN